MKRKNHNSGLKRTVTTKHTEEQTRQGLKEAMDAVSKKMDMRLHAKGPGFFIDRHQVWGLLDEEVGEFKDEIHRKDPHKARIELIDIAVAALWGIASFDASYNCRDCMDTGELQGVKLFDKHECHCVNHYAGKQPFTPTCSDDIEVMDEDLCEGCMGHEVCEIQAELWNGVPRTEVFFFNGVLSCDGFVSNKKDGGVWPKLNASPWPAIETFIQQESLATCIGCGCTDNNACMGENGACHWLKVNRETGFGICSACPEFFTEDINLVPMPPEETTLCVHQLVWADDILCRITDVIRPSEVRVENVGYPRVKKCAGIFSIADIKPLVVLTNEFQQDGAE